MTSLFRLFFGKHHWEILDGPARVQHQPCGRTNTGIISMQTSCGLRQMHGFISEFITTDTEIADSYPQRVKK